MAAIFLYLLLLLSVSKLSFARAVFCHYMVGNVNEDHAQQDIIDAQGLGFSGFALNIGDPTQSFVRETLDFMFSHAKAVGFKLYISIDLYASGNACYTRNPQCTSVYKCFQIGLSGCNGPFDYSWIWTRYDVWSAASGYYQVEGRPFISTYSSGGYTNDTWISWKKGLGRDIWFVPDFDETEGYYEAADGWWYYWGPIVDGVFSWETAWPEYNGFGSDGVGDVSVDQTVLNGVRAHLKTYMMGLSPFQYKDSYGTNIYRRGDINLPTRMMNILAMNPSPDYIEFQTWNDGPESHYIGNLWPEQNTDAQPAAYASQTTFPHTGWQSLVASFNHAFLTGQTSSTGMTPQDGSVATGALWYKTIRPFSVVCPSSTDPYFQPPTNFQTGAEELIWSVVLSPAAKAGPYSVTAYSHNELSTPYTTTLKPGLNYGVSNSFPAPGAQSMVLRDGSGSVIMSASGGACVSAGCPSKIYNSNYQVVPLVSGAGTSNCHDLPNLYLRDAATVCAIVSETSNADMPAAINVAANAWTSSSAGSYLNTFLTYEKSNAGVTGPSAWTFDFFNTVVGCGNSSGNTDFDCTDLVTSTCAKPDVCTTYCPPEAYIIHKSIWQLFSGYKSLKDQLTRQAISEITITAGEIAGTFAPVDTELKEVLTVVGGVLSTVSALSVFAGDFAFPVIGTFGDGMAAIGAIFANANGYNPTDADEKGTLQDIMAAVMTAYYGHVDQSVASLFDASGADVNVDLVNSIFAGGAWLNPQVVTAVINATTTSFISALNQYAIIQAMRDKTASGGSGPYASGWALLYSTDESNTEAKCDSLADHSMIWHDSKCMGFGHFSETLSPGQNGVIQFSTSFLTGKEKNALISFVPNLPTAIINAYECGQSGQDTSTWPSINYNAASGDYPTCFWAIGSTPISSAR